MQILRQSWLLAAVLLLGGCTSVTGFKGIAIDEDSIYISGLPPVRQNQHYACGASCVAAVAAFWNVPFTEFRAKHPSVPADLTGQDLQVMACDLGLQAFAYRGSMDDLQENLRKGRPVIVVIPQPLIPGDSLTSALLFNAIIIHDPASGPMTMKQAVFESWWAKKNNLTVLLTAQ